MRKITCALLLLCGFFAQSQIVINELDCDTPSTDDKEFVELRSETPNFSLDGYVLVFFNGNPDSNKSYFAVDLDGYTTDINGIFVIGSSLVSPVPDKIISDNVIQNGPDAVALYLGNASDFPMDTLATTNNLVDALAYGTSDPDATALMNLLGLTNQIDENLSGQVTQHSIQRKPDGTYEVKNPTPGANNDGSGFIYNGVRIDASTLETTEGATIEITFTALNELTEELAFSFTLSNDGFGSGDFTGSISVVIPAGSQSVVRQIEIVDDELDEGDELAVIRFGVLPFGYNRVNDNIGIRVIDNDFYTLPFGTPLAPTYGMVSSTAPEGYYDSLNGKSGTELFQAIQDIIANPQVVRSHTYGDAELILRQADQNPLNSNEVWLMYVESPRAKYKFQSTSSSVGSWNREHIFPQSRGGFANATSSTADGIDIYLPTNANDIAAGHSDAHHIRAEDGPENSSRSNRDYGTDYNGPVGNQGSWKGDVARSLFYMAVRYNGLSLVNGNPPDSTPGQMADLASLLVWNTTDPADDFEMNRNNIVYTWQYNRNPFIDYPQLADYLWGSLVGQEWQAPLSTGQHSRDSIVLYPQPADSQFTVSNFEGEVEIFSLSGMLLKRLNISNHPVDHELPSGIYVAKFISGSQSTVKKLIIR